MGKRRFFSALGLVQILFLAACGTKDPVETVMPSSKNLCGGRAIENQFIVQWSDNPVSTVKDIEFDAMKEDVVRPNLASIKRVEYDQKFKPQQFTTTAVRTINNWGFRSTSIDSLWKLGYRGQGVIVAVVDSGVDITHPVLKNQLAVNAGEAGALAQNGIDDDHNGYIDDYQGYSFYDDTSDVTDNVVHGTHVAGIIAAEHAHDDVVDDELLGMAPNAKILPVKFLDEDGGSLSSAIAAVSYAADRGAKIINASWGGNGCSDILKDKILELGNRGILFIAASGNNGRNIDLYPEYPAAFQNTSQITVGAISPFFGMANFSNYSPTLVHLFAPGQDIVSSVPGGQSAALSGTSMATPFVSGAAAAILSSNPSMSLSRLRTIIMTSVATSSNYSNATRGRMDLSRAVSLLH